MDQSSSSGGLGWLLAVLGPAGAAGLGLMLRPQLEPHVLPPFLLAIAGAALLGGLGPGLFAAALSAVAVNYWFFPPPDLLGFTSQADLVAQLVFWASSLLVAALCAWSRAWRLRAENEAAVLSSEQQAARAELAALESAVTRARAEEAQARALQEESGREQAVRARARAEEERLAALEQTARPEHTALVADDDAEARRLACHALESAGFRWLSACDGTEALELLERYDFPIEVAVIEVLLPDMRGESLADRLMARHPGMAILYTSTVPNEELVSRGLLRPHEPLVAKPFTAEQLLGALAVSSGER
jgi:CheY-like chemotaxis protein